MNTELQDRQETKQVLTSKTFRIVVTCEFVIILFYVLLYVTKGELHVDEPGYVYTAQQIAAGLVPYHDFLFVQSPVFPYVYAIPFTFFDLDFTQARLFMALFGLGTIILSMVLGYRLAGPVGACLTGYMFAISPFQLHFYAIARNYSLATFWLCAGFIFSTGRGRRSWTLVMAMIFFVLAAGTRLTLTPVPAIYSLYLLWLYSWKKRQFWLPLLAGAVTCGLIFIPLAAPDPARFFYNIIGFHLDITVGGFKQRILLKASGISKLAAAYFVSVVMMVCAALLYWTWRDHPLKGDHYQSERRVLGLMVALILVIGGGHFSAKFFQASYQSILFPLAAVVTATLLSPLLTKLRAGEPRALVVVLFLGLVPLSLLAHGRTSLALTPGSRDLASAQKTAVFLAEHTQPEATIMSFDSAFIPFLAGRRVMQGFEGLEYFTYWSADRAQHMRVHNHDQIKDLIIQKRADVILLSSQSFCVVIPLRIMAPAEYRLELVDLIEQHYHKVGTFPHAITPGEETMIYFRTITDQTSKLEPEKGDHD